MPPRLLLPVVLLLPVEVLALRPQLAGVEVGLLKQDPGLAVAPAEEVARRLDVVPEGPADASDGSSSA